MRSTSTSAPPRLVDIQEECFAVNHAVSMFYKLFTCNLTIHVIKLGFIARIHSLALNTFKSFVVCTKSLIHQFWSCPTYISVTIVSTVLYAASFFHVISSKSALKLRTKENRQIENNIAEQLFKRIILKAVQLFLFKAFVMLLFLEINFKRSGNKKLKTKLRNKCFSYP